MLSNAIFVRNKLLILISVALTYLNVLSTISFSKINCIRRQNRVDDVPGFRLISTSFSFIKYHNWMGTNEDMKKSWSVMDDALKLMKFCLYYACPLLLSQPHLYNILKCFTLSLICIDFTVFISKIRVTA